MDIRHFVILECRHLANGCILTCGCIGLMLFRNLSCLGTIIMTLWLQVMQPLANVHETKWTPHVKRESDVAVHIIAVVIYTIIITIALYWLLWLILLFIFVVGVLRHNKYLKAVLHSTNVFIGTIVV